MTIPYISGAIAAAALTVLAGTVQAAVVISDRATQNMVCANGVCTPTSADAVLNTGDLETLLAAGNVTVTTRGPGVQAHRIDIADAFSWSTTSALTLHSRGSIRVDAKVAVEGQGGLAIQSGDYRGAFSFTPNGHVCFANLASSLTIGGGSYMLENSIKSLAKAFRKNPNSRYALARSYDAGKDGTYDRAPIDYLRGGGEFEGLGNSISNLTIVGAKGDLALFRGLFEGSDVSDVTLKDVSVTSTGGGSVGALVAYDVGRVTGAHANGSVTGHRRATAGGLVGWVSNRSSGMYNDDANVTVLVDGDSEAGGLVGESAGAISECYALGSVTARGNNTRTGGLVGENVGSIENAYALGRIRGTDSGGLIGYNGDGVEPGAARFSYSTGKVEASAYAGGLIGFDDTRGANVDRNYWDLITSGITNRSQGAGSPPNDHGLHGLKTKRLQSGLPKGFDPKVWAEDPDINDGLPYLLSDPPQ